MRDEESQQEMRNQLASAKSGGQQLIEQAREVAERYREDELAKARNDIQSERIRAEANIQKERDAAIEELRREFASLAITAAERVIEGSLDESRHRNIIDKVLEDAPKTSSV